MLGALTFEFSRQPQPANRARLHPTEAPWLALGGGTEQTLSALSMAHRMRLFLTPHLLFLTHKLRTRRSSADQALYRDRSRERKLQSAAAFNRHDRNDAVINRSGLDRGTGQSNFNTVAATVERVKWYSVKLSTARHIPAPINRVHLICSKGSQRIGYFDKRCDRRTKQSPAVSSVRRVDQDREGSDHWR